MTPSKIRERLHSLERRRDRLEQRLADPDFRDSSRRPTARELAGIQFAIDIVQRGHDLSRGLRDLADEYETRDNAPSLPGYGHVDGLRAAALIVENWLRLRGERQGESAQVSDGRVGK